MRRLLITALSLASLGLLTETALAGKIVLTGTHSRADIKSHCDAAGGILSDEPGGGYGCNGPGGFVGCTKNGSCVGICNACGTIVPQSGLMVTGVLVGGRGVRAR
jgi:hypothetical protein